MRLVFWHAACTFAVVLLPALVGSAAWADWTVRSVPRPDGTGTRCVVESERHTLPDGYQTTTAVVIVDSDSVRVASRSNFDAGQRDIGLSVDEAPLVPLDRLAGPKTAVWETTHAQLIEQFKAGLTLRVQLRFWPEWPATGTHSATVSLVGFTKAYGELDDCR